MTRKDYIALAAALREVRQIAKEKGTLRQREVASYTIWEAVMRIADVLQDDNPRFDRSRFEAATKV